MVLSSAITQCVSTAERLAQKLFDSVDDRQLANALVALLDMSLPFKKLQSVSTGTISRAAR
jgi:hypothetical protein